MAQSKQQKLLERYRGRIEGARGYRRSEGLPDLWERMLDLYRGKHFPKGWSQDDVVAVNVSKATIDVMVPATSVQHPEITVEALKPDMDDQAVITQAAVNYEWRHHNFTPETMMAVKDALIFGVGWAKCGWRFVEETVVDEDGARKQLAELEAQVDRYAADNPELAGSLPSPDELRAQVETSTKQVVKEDHPFVERVNIHDVYVDPDATSIRDAKWIAQRVVKPLEEVRSNKRYRLSARLNVRADSGHPEDWYTSHDEWRSNDDVKRVTVWEFYDLRLGTMSVFADGGDNGFLVEPVKQPYAFGHPFVPIIDYEVPNQFYGMGELEAVEPLQMELNMTRTAMFNDRKAHRRAWLYNEKAFDAKGRSALESDAENRLIPVSNNVPFSEALVPLPGQSPNPQLYQDSGIIESDITTVTGINDYQRGSLPEVRRTATEASIVQDAANARAAEKLAKVEGFLSEIARRVVMLMQQYQTGERVARYTGRNGASQWVQYDADWIQGEYDFSVEAGSTQPRNDTARRQQATQMLQALAPFMVPGGPVNPQAVIEHALRYGFKVTDPSKFLNEPQQALGMPPPSPLPPELSAADNDGGLGGEPEPRRVPQPARDMQEGLGQSAGGPIPDQHSGGGIPPEILQQLAGQVGLGA